MLMSAEALRKVDLADRAERLMLADWLEDQGRRREAGLCRREPLTPRLRDLVVRRGGVVAPAPFRPPEAPESIRHRWAMTGELAEAVRDYCVKHSVTCLGEWLGPCGVRCNDRFAWTDCLPLARGPEEVLDAIAREVRAKAEQVAWPKGGERAVLLSHPKELRQPRSAAELCEAMGDEAAAAACRRAAERVEAVVAEALALVRAACGAELYDLRRASCERALPGVRGRDARKAHGLLCGFPHFEWAVVTEKAPTPRGLKYAPRAGGSPFLHYRKTTGGACRRPARLACVYPAEFDAKGGERR
jgi:uncharacterized protein (TIGR02996 family)